MCAGRLFESPVRRPAGSSASATRRVGWAGRTVRRSRAPHPRSRPRRITASGTARSHETTQLPPVSVKGRGEKAGGPVRKCVPAHPLQGTAEVLGRRPSGIHLRRTRWRTPAADMGVSSPMMRKYHQRRRKRHGFHGKGLNMAMMCSFRRGRCFQQDVSCNEAITSSSVN